MFQIGEIVWGRMRGFPWWPARIVTPTPDQLGHLSVTKVPPDCRLLWFFNDNDRYSIVNVKSLSPFSNPELTLQTKKKTGKSANRLKLAFSQAVEQHRSATNHHPVLVHPPNPKPTQNSKPSDTSPRLVSPSQKAIPPEPRNRTHRNPNSAQHRTEPPRKLISRRYTQLTPDHLPPSKPPKKSLLLRLRIREPYSVQHKPRISSRSNSYKRTISKNTRPHSLAASESPNPLHHLPTEHPQLNHKLLRNPQSSSYSERTKRVTKPSLKLRQEASQKHEHPVKRTKPQTSHAAVKRIKLETSDVQSPDSKFQSKRDVTSRDRYFPTSKQRPLSESKHSIKSRKVRGLDKTDRSKTSIQHSKRMRRTIRRDDERDDESDDDSSVESEDEHEPPVGSKRSRGLEAPRLSDGQRRLHFRQEGNKDSRTSKQDNADHKRRAAQRAKRLAMGNASDDAQDFAARPFEALTKDQCVTMIRGMQEALRRKNVRIWVQGRRLAKSEEVKRTEKDLLQACQPGIARVEKLLGWAKRHQDYDSGAGSRFASMEEKAVEECKDLINVYFDRRKVSLREIGCRVLNLTKQLPEHSRKLTSVLEELLVLWVDLTSGQS